MKDRAYAKINLSLDVFNIREDGYHDLCSIMVPIDFYDELEIIPDLRDSFTCNKRFIRYNENNSIYKMITLMKEHYDIADHHRIGLKKVIPTQAGLGGGTADAASVLRIFKKLYHLDLNKEEIIDLCLKVGADVPFNYFNTPAVVKGIGDVIEPFDMAKKYYVLLVKPRSGVSTREAYQKLDMEICDHPDILSLKKALENGEPLTGLLGNSLEQPALLLNEDIRKVKERLEGYRCGEVLMSGSGSTVFCISEEEREIKAIYEDLRGENLYVRFTATL